MNRSPVKPTISRISDISRRNFLDKDNDLDESDEENESEMDVRGERYSIDPTFFNDQYKHIDFSNKLKRDTSRDNLSLHLGLSSKIDSYVASAMKLDHMTDMDDINPSSFHSDMINNNQNKRKKDNEEEDISPKQPRRMIETSKSLPIDVSILEDRLNTLVISTVHSQSTSQIPHQNQLSTTTTITTTSVETIMKRQPSSDRVNGKMISPDESSQDVESTSTPISSKLSSHIITNESPVILPTRLFTETNSMVIIETLDELIHDSITANNNLVSQREEVRKILCDIEWKRTDLQERINDTENKILFEQRSLSSKRTSYQIELNRIEKTTRSLNKRWNKLEEQVFNLQSEVNTSMDEKLLQEKESLKSQLKEAGDERKTILSELSSIEVESKMIEEKLLEQLQTYKSELGKLIDEIDSKKYFYADKLNIASQKFDECKDKINIYMEEYRVKYNRKLTETVHAMDNIQKLIDSNSSPVRILALQSQLEQIEVERDFISNESKTIEQKIVLYTNSIQQQSEIQKDELKNAVQRMTEDLGYSSGITTITKSGMSSTNVSANTSIIFNQLIPLSPPNNRISPTFTSSGRTTPRFSNVLTVILEDSEMNSVDDDISSNNSNGNNSSNVTVINSNNHNNDNTNNQPSMKVDNLSSLNVRMEKMEPKSPLTSVIRNHAIQDIKIMEENEDEDEKFDEFSYLPGPHAAAMRGDLTRLMVFYKTEPSLLASVDEFQRSPLYYAMLHGELTNVKYLLELFPELITRIDINGETICHAACSAGSSKCLELLLKICETVHTIILKDYVNLRNKAVYPIFPILTCSVGMTPSHLAKNADCLETLYNYSADLTLLDNDGRSPLFISCALNRVEGAEFIIHYLDLDNSSIMLRDYRGDTPLHAAACNGAVECLLLLLQYAIDPTITDKKGFKAVELAIKNHHKECQKLLTEYTMHYYSHSDFDSVLFLAALEGHKRIKKEVKHMNLGDTEEYHILQPTSSSNSTNSSRNNSTHDIRKRRRGSHNHSTNSSMRQNYISLFSLKSNQTMKMQRWGRWISYEDQNTKKIYWFNHETYMGQWEIPSEVQMMQTKIMEQSGHEKAYMNINNISMKLRKIGEWIEYSTHTGQTFYYNDKTGDFQWKNPYQTSTSTPTKSPVTNNMITSLSNSNVSVIDTGIVGESFEHQCQNLHHHHHHQQQQPSSLSSIHSQSLHQFGDWKPYMDPATGYVFWYNHVTCVSQWDCPVEVQQRTPKNNMNPSVILSSMNSTDYVHSVSDNNNNNNNNNNDDDNVLNSNIYASSTAEGSIDGDDINHDEAQVVHDSEDLGI